ncbi:methyltransferase [Metamycoplasma cloacale]|nr:methyltransferase [Metamycoplasma cloacale]
MLKEVIEQLEIKPDGIYVDLTLGRAGHSKEILKQLTTGKLICFDKDQQALDESINQLKEINDNFVLIKSDFRYAKKELEKIGITEINGLLADFGVSSPQLDQITRGFSYSLDCNLDMRMDLNSDLKATDILNTFSEQEITKILIENADVKFAQRIAKAICENRPINNSFSLNEIIRKSLPAKIVREKNPSKAVFQAIRIAVNDELNAIKDLLEDIHDLIKVRGKMLFITFHSKEDAIVKKYFQNLTYRDPLLNKLPIQINDNWKQKIIFPSEEEIQINKRSRSAKLRVITRLE